MITDISNKKNLKNKIDLTKLSNLLSPKPPKYNFFNIAQG